METTRTKKKAKPMNIYEGGILPAGVLAPPVVAIQSALDKNGVLTELFACPGDGAFCVHVVDVDSGYRVVFYIFGIGDAGYAGALAKFEKMTAPRVSA